MKTFILIVEDEAAIREMVRFALKTTNYELLEAENCQQAEVLIADHAPKLILLDWMLPGRSGVEFAKQLKENSTTQDIPIIMLTARAEEENKIKALEIGADDYMTKPFSPREMIARIQTVLRRGPLINLHGKLQFEKLTLNINTHEISIEENKLSLSPTTYQLLQFFLHHQERIYNRQQLLDKVWPGKLDIDERTVDAQIKRLRKELAPFGYDNFIKTVRGSGYYFGKNNEK